MSSPDDIVVGFKGELYVSNGFGSGVNSVTVFAPGASGNVAPIQDITGSNTTFGNPDDLGVDASGSIFVTDASSTSGAAVMGFGRGQRATRPGHHLDESLTTSPSQKAGHGRAPITWRPR